MSDYVYVLIYTHRFGVDVFPVRYTRPLAYMPDPFKWLAERQVSVEPEREDEWAEWAGPLKVMDVMEE